MPIEKLTDMGLVLMLAGHIRNPCSVVVEGQTHNIRNFYLREAERLLTTLEDGYAIDSLKAIIEEYK